MKNCIVKMILTAGLNENMKYKKKMRGARKFWI
jgi:hypothetical protein